MKKRILSAFIAMIMAFTCLNLTVFADDEETAAPLEIGNFKDQADLKDYMSKFNDSFMDSLWGYGSRSHTSFEKAYNFAEESVWAGYEGDEVTAYNAAYWMLRGAEENLMKKTLAELTTLRNTTRATYNGFNVFNDLGDTVYSTETYEKFQDAFDNAEAVIAERETDSRVLTDAWVDLDDGFKNLDKLESVSASAFNTEIRKGTSNYANRYKYMDEVLSTQRWANWWHVIQWGDLWTGHIMYEGGWGANIGSGDGAPNKDILGIRAKGSNYYPVEWVTGNFKDSRDYDTEAFPTGYRERTNETIVKDYKFLVAINSMISSFRPDATNSWTTLDGAFSQLRTIINGAPNFFAMDGDVLAGRRPCGCNASYVGADGAYGVSGRGTAKVFTNNDGADIGGDIIVAGIDMTSISLGELFYEITVGGKADKEALAAAAADYKYDARDGNEGVKGDAKNHPMDNVNRKAAQLVRIFKYMTDFANKRHDTRNVSQVKGAITTSNRYDNYKIHSNVQYIEYDGFGELIDGATKSVDELLADVQAARSNASANVDVNTNALCRDVEWGVTPGNGQRGAYDVWAALANPDDSAMQKYDRAIAQFTVPTWISTPIGEDVLSAFAMMEKTARAGVAEEALVAFGLALVKADTEDLEDGMSIWADTALLEDGRIRNNSATHKAYIALSEAVEEEEAAAAAAANKGDVNGDGEIDTADALLVLRAAVGAVELDEAQTAAADVNGDGVVDTADALLILKFAVGAITEF